MTPEHLDKTDLSQIDLLFIFDLPSEGILAVNQLREILRNRGSIVFFGQSNPIFQDLLPEVGGMETKLTSFSPEGAGFLAPFKMGQLGDLSEPVFSEYRAITHQETSPYDILLSFQNGFPAVTKQKIDEGYVVYLAFNLDLAPQSLSTNPVVVPFFHLLTRSLVSQFTPIPKPDVKHSVLYKLDSSEINGEIELYTPFKRNAVELKVGPGKDFVSFDDTQIAGHYNLFIKGKNRLRKEGFSVNIPAEEKDFRKVDMEKLKSYLASETEKKEKNR